MDNNDNQIIKEYGFIKYLLDQGADIATLELEYDEYETLTSMNPSIWINKDGSAYINIRAVNYNLFNSRYREYTQEDQPIAYVCLDQHHLKTENYFGTFDINTLQIKDISKVKMMNLHKPLWSFHGLEDARIIHWDNSIYLCGVRRDTKDDGEGRQELSKIENIDNEWVEVERIRIPAAGDDKAYLEKNWMPIIDKPWHWLKWCSPVEIANYDINERVLKIEYKNTAELWFRGDSQLIHIDGYYYCFTHDVLNYFINQDTNARMSLYKHYVLKFDNELNYIGKFGPFSYDNRISIEFGCGLAEYNGNCYLTYSENDTSVFIIKFNTKILEELDYE